MGQERQDTNASPESPSLLEPDRAALEIFVDAIFRHAGTQGFVSLRGFFEGDASKPFRITPVSLAGDLKFLVDAAEDDARRAALDPKAVVFAPPLAVFAIKERAREKDIALGLALSVELDQDPQQAREQLEQLLGPATITVKSGGLWTDPKTGEIHDKLHLHWRLAKPAAQGVAIAKLKEARDLAARLVGGDPSNQPVCHPIRWPGSWHRKAAPRLCAIETANPDAEIDLDAALATLIVPPLHVDRPQGTRNGNADPGTGAGDWGELVGNIIAGENLHASITPLAMKLLRAGMMDVAAVRLLRGILDSSSAPRDTRWQTRWDYVPRAVSSARAKLDEQATTAADRAIHWHGEIDTAASRAWLLQDLLPEVGRQRPRGRSMGDLQDLHGVRYRVFRHDRGAVPRV
jgi:hypothetical protein